MTRAVNLNVATQAVDFTMSPPVNGQTIPCLKQDVRPLLAILKQLNYSEMLSSLPSEQMAYRSSTVRLAMPSREFLFAARTEIPEITGVREAYLGFIPASQFLSIITDENGEILNSIFYDNVRDWQGDNPVNSEIRRTLESPETARFVLMNNGITIIARNLLKTASRFTIEDFQIVNGCQTSPVLFGYSQSKKIEDSVMIPLRLIATQDEGVIEAIIRATNRQTEVKSEQFFAITDFAKQLEIFFQAFL